MNSQLRFLIEQYYDMQEYRIAMGNQIFQLKEQNEDITVMEYYFTKFYVLEKEVKRDIGKIVHKDPMWKKYFKGVKGIGEIFAGAILATIDITKADHASSVWKYCGLDVAEDGLARSRRKEHLVPKTYVDKNGKEKETVGITFNPFLKKTCWLIGKSFIKVKGKYRNIYDSSKEYYQKKFPQEMVVDGHKKYTKGHIDAMARRRTVKLFLSEMWATWREQEGLPVSVPYAHRGL